MRAIRYQKFGEPSKVLEVVDIDVPPLKADEVLIRMKLRPINPSDLLTIRGTYPNRITFPAVPGYEGMGIIVDAGKQVKNLPIGRRVLALRGMWNQSPEGIYLPGTWQELIVAKSHNVILVPNEIDDVTAAQLYINPLTAWMMLKYELNLGEGDIVIANACGSAIGKCFAKLSSLFGYELIGVTRSDFYTQTLLQLGTKKVINISKESIVDTVLAYTNGKGVAAVLDAVGGKEGINLAKCVKKGGTMLLYGLLSGEQHPIDIKNYLHPGAQIRNYWLREWVCKTPINERRAIFSDMIDHFVRHGILLSTGPIFDLGDIAQAIKAAESSNCLGKVMFSG